ncbi:hypothetical protein BaRGS_00040470, partial [Batillaria attramentaria]
HSARRVSQLQRSQCLQQLFQLLSATVSTKIAACDRLRPKCPARLTDQRLPERNIKLFVDIFASVSVCPCQGSSEEDQFPGLQ